VNEVLAADPKNCVYARGDKPVLALIRELTEEKRASYIHIKKGNFSLTLA
jgi:hypothetical protein